MKKALQYEDALGTLQNSTNQIKEIVDSSVSLLAKQGEVYKEDLQKLSLQAHQDITYMTKCAQTYMEDYSKTKTLYDLNNKNAEYLKSTTERMSQSLKSYMDLYFSMSTKALTSFAKK